MKHKRTESFTIDYPDNKAERKRWMKDFGLNAIYAGKHWSARGRDSEYWNWLVRICMQRQGVPKQPFDRPVTIRFYWHDNLDIDNHAYMGKLIADAMKGYLLHDDDRRYYRAVTHAYQDEDCIRVAVEEV